jgi:hypothetical protein
MARATGPFLVEKAEIFRRVFRKQTFLENFPLAFPDKDLGPGRAAESDFYVCAVGLCLQGSLAKAV